MNSQNEKVLHHLETNRCITSMEAFMCYGITRLSARISDLRDKGYPIKTTIVTKKNKEGNACNFAEYRLEKESMQE